MSRRIEIELTSAQANGTWTWRAAGARQPRGSLDGGLLPAQAKAGDVLRADAEFEIEGITIVSVLAPREKKRDEPERIEIIAPPESSESAVTTQLASRAERRPSDRRRERDGSPARDASPRDRPRPSGREGASGPLSGGRGSAARSESRSESRSERKVSDRDRTERAPTDGPRPERSSRPGARTDRAPGGQRRSDDHPRHRDQVRPDVRPVPAGAAPRNDAQARGRRLNPGNAHRAAILEDIPAEEQPVAEQVLRGGLPAVRTAIHLEREKATAEGRPAPNADALLAMAERLLPRLKAAEWLDRADAAVKSVDDIALRDLRSLVAGADVARDDSSRELAATLRAGLERRVTGLRNEWIEEITRHLDEGKVVRALRLAGRPPEPQSQIPAPLAGRLSDVAGQAMAVDTPPEQWAALLDAVAASPVRRTVKPAGLPGEMPAELLRTAHQQSGRVPALVSMLGIPMPPPPGPPRAITAALGRPSGRPRGPRRPPPPGRQPPAAEPAAAEPAAAEPTATEPTAAETVADQPAATVPVVDHPVADQPGTPDARS